MGRVLQVAFTILILFNLTQGALSVTSGGASICFNMFMGENSAAKSGTLFGEIALAHDMLAIEESDDLRTIKALPLWQGFLAAIIAPIIIGLIFAILGAQRDAFILQLELILVSIGFCLTGILTRSKLRGLLSIFAAPIAWFPMFLLDTLTAGWYVNPYGLIAEMAGPLTALLKNAESLGPQFAGIAEYGSVIQPLLIIVDLLI